MTAKDLKVGSIIELPTNSEKGNNIPTRDVIVRCTEHFLWFKYNSYERIKRTTFDTCVTYFGYKIISL